MKKAFSSIFDQEEIDLISFSLAKPTRFAPVKGLLSDAMGILSADGACKQICAPVECTELGPECFGDEGSCECYDTEGDPFEATPGKTGGRCETGKYCLLINGKACEDCCQPGEGMSCCKRTWRTEKEKSPNGIGDFVKSGRCGTVSLAEDFTDSYETSAKALTSASGEWLDRSTDKSCGCRQCEQLPSGKTKEQVALETSERCCGRLKNDEYMVGDTVLEIPECVDSEGNKIEYVRRYFANSQINQYPCYRCWCPGTIKWKYNCAVDGEKAVCKKSDSHPFTGSFGTKQECEEAMSSGSAECGIHWACDAESTEGDPCKPTKDAVDESHANRPVFGNKQDCIDNCQYGYSCDVVDGVDKCVRKISAYFNGENAKSECESALAAGDCGIHYECKLEGENRICSPTKQDSLGSTFFDSRAECESNCVVEFECRDNNTTNEVDCRRIVAYRPSGQTEPFNSEHFATMEACQSAVSAGTCANITFFCRLGSDGGSECVPTDFYAGVRKTYGECMNDCSVRYRCKKFSPLPTSCEPFVADTEAEKNAPGVYATEQECCDNCCGCLESHGKCEYSKTYSGFANDWDICSFGVTKQFCNSVNGNFTCCKSETEAGCACPGCPSGQPAAECTSSEFKEHKQGSTFGFGDECFCECMDQYQGNFNGESVCIVCGENSEALTGSARGCRCLEGYETATGLQTANPSTFGPNEGGTGEGRHPGTDGRKKAIFEDCFPKKYRCDITKEPPECVYVEVSDRQEGESYFDSVSDCQQNGCGRYNCSGQEECVPADADAGVSGSFPDKDDCEAACGKYECHSETTNGSTTSTCIRNPSGPYSGKKACEDAGCGKFKCVDGQCVPDLAGPFSDFGACMAANCGKWYCTDDLSQPADNPECKKNTTGSWPSGADVFESDEACKTAGCGNFSCSIEQKNGVDVGDCVGDRSGAYPNLEACQQADPPCECPPGNTLCTNVNPRKCVPSCTAPEFLLNNCKCGTCEAGEEEVVAPDGKKHCCPPCPEVWDDSADPPEKRGIRNSTNNNPCNCCNASDAACENLGNDPLRRWGCWVGITQNGDCYETPMCRANAVYDSGTDKCECANGYKFCENGGGCVKCHANRIMDEQSCTCYCGKNQCPCGLEEDCSCKAIPVVGTCHEIAYNYPSKGHCTKITKRCPPGQFLKNLGKVMGQSTCECYCINGNAPDANTGLCDNTVSGPQGPVPPAGGGGGDGGGGDEDGGGSSGSSVKCPANASAGSDGQCFCNYPQSFYSEQNGGYCACSAGYVYGSDGQTCVDPWQPGGADGIGGSFMPDLYVAQENMCLGIECPEDQSCIQTVFGAMCR